jgi:hypothetical protein
MGFIKGIGGNYNKSLRHKHTLVRCVYLGTKYRGRR